MPSTDAVFDRLRNWLAYTGWDNFTDPDQISLGDLTRYLRDVRDACPGWRVPSTSSAVRQWRHINRISWHALMAICVVEGIHPRWLVTGDARYSPIPPSSRRSDP